MDSLYARDETGGRKSDFIRDLGNQSSDTITATLILISSMMELHSD